MSAHTLLVFQSAFSMLTELPPGEGVFCYTSLSLDNKYNDLVDSKSITRYTCFTVYVRLLESRLECIKVARKRLYYTRRGSRCKVTQKTFTGSDGKHYVASYCQTHQHYLLDCLNCGEHFHTDRPHTKWCSAKCAQAAYRQRKLA